MYTTQFYTPSTLDEAVALATEHSNARMIAGGQSIVPMLKEGTQDATQLISLGSIDGLKNITLTESPQGQVIRIGAMASHAAIANHPLCQEHLPGVVAMIAELADHQVRNQGTIGGSLAFSDPRADWGATCLAYGCTLHTSQGEVAMDDFIQGAHTNILAPGQIIVAIDFPTDQQFAYAKHRHPSSRWAMVGVAIAKSPSGSLRVAIAGAGKTVYRDALLEASLITSHTSIDKSKISTAANSAYVAHLVQLQAEKAFTAL